MRRERGALPGALLLASALVFVVAHAVGAEPAAAQERSVLERAALPAGPGLSAPPPAFQPDAGPRVSPGGAFLRGLLIPGWGHAATGSYTRGGFYFVAQGGTIWMLHKTVALRSSARRIHELTEEVTEARLRAEGVTDPDTLRFAVEEDAEVQQALTRVDARSQQFEDWAALGIFLVLMSAADAFVSGHLQDFPPPLSIRAAPAPGSAFGAVEIGLSLPWRGPEHLPTWRGKK